MRDVAHSAAPPDQAPYAVAEAVFADAKAYLSSREAQRRRRPYGVVIDLIHVAEYVCRRCLCSIATGVIEGACGTWSATVMEFTGARWCYPVPLFHPCAGLDPPGGQLGWSRGGSEAPGATKPAATSMRTGTSTTREYQRGTTPSDTLME